MTNFSKLTLKAKTYSIFLLEMFLIK